MSVKIEKCDQKSLEEIPFWAVTEEDPEETFLSATSIDEAIEEWKENIRYFLQEDETGIISAFAGKISPKIIKINAIIDFFIITFLNN